MATEFEAFFQRATFNAPLNGELRSHLKNVYSSLTLSVLAAAGGASTVLLSPRSSLFSAGGGGFWGLLAFGLAMALHFTPDNGKNWKNRMALLLGFAFFSGLGSGPLMSYAVALNPSLLPTAFLLSSTLFACFSGVALYAPSGHYLYLGGTLISALSTLFWLGLANIFFQSTMIFQLSLWAGLAVFCGFVVYDTQMIIEKRRRGEKDFIKHSLGLFIDFMQLFKRILILLIQKEQNGQRKKNNRR